MKNTLLRSALVAALSMAGSFAVAAPAGCPGLFVSSGYVRAPAPGAGAVAAYGTLNNSTANPITVTGVTAEGFADAALHQSKSGGGMAGMSHVEALAIPAKGSVELAPGGYHIMLTGPAGQLRAKDSVRLKLQCGAGSLPVTLPVEAGN